jgi:long-chain acyl-CoA synthetase
MRSDWHSPRTLGEQVHAIVVLKPGQALTERELIDLTKTLIAGYKCPGSVCFLERSQPLSGAKRILKD